MLFSTDTSVFGRQTVIGKMEEIGRERKRRGFRGRDMVKVEGEEMVKETQRELE